MYYYFLEDNLIPVRPVAETGKSAIEFNYRAKLQIEDFNNCIQDYQESLREDNQQVFSILSNPESEVVF
jgi:hypothetical protein